MHLRFDQHKELHRPTCFKKNDECRANHPMMVCSKLYLFDNKYILANSNGFHVARASENARDEELQAMKEVNWYHLSQICAVTEVMQIFSHSKAAVSMSISESA